MTAVGYTASGLVRRDGDTMTGPLALPGSPTLPLEAATKGYVDAHTHTAPEYGPADHGQVGWTFPWQQLNTGGASTFTAGVVFLARIKTVAVATISQASFYITTVGATLANSFVGLYSADGTLQASTANQGTAWQSGGLKQPAFSTPYASAPAGFYWLALLVGSANTMPVWARSSSSSVFTGVPNLGLSAGAGNLRYATSGTGQTALPATITPTTMAAADLPLWLSAA